MAEQVGARQRLDRKPRRHLRGDGFEQLRGALDAGAIVDPPALVSAAIEHGEPGVEGGAPPCVGAAVDGGGERHAGRWNERCEGIHPGGIAGNAVGGCDGHQPPARRQHGEGRADVAQVGVVADAVHTGAGRERRVHQDDGGTEAGQVVGDGLGVVAGDRSGGEDPGEKPGAGCGDLVEMKRPAGLLAERAFGHDREHAGAGGGFEHDIAGPDGGSLEGGVGERERRRELLQRDLFLGSPRLGRLQGGEGLQHGEHGGGTAGPGAGLPAHGAAVALEEENQRRLGRLVGVLPEPGALAVARTECAGHGLAQDRRVERTARLENRKQGPGGGQQCGRFRRDGRPGSDRRGCGGRGYGGGGQARGRGRRRMGVEHGQAPVTGV